MDPNKVDAYILERFQSSFLNNTKWEKLLDRLTNVFGEIFLYYKTIYSDEIKLTSFDLPDLQPYFIEPILYKEVEWIQFPKQFEDYISLNNLKAGKKKYIQDIGKIENEIKRIGHFEIETTDKFIKMYAYK